MKRREFITLLGGAAVAWPLVARAQQVGKVLRIGFLSGATREIAANVVDGFRQGMRKALLGNPANPNHSSVLVQVQAAARAAGFVIVPMDTREPADIDNAFAVMPKERVQAIMGSADAFFVSQRQRIAELALGARLPSMFVLREFVEAGGLMSYGESVREFNRRAAAFVDKIVKGAKPGELPIEQPTRFHLVINRKTADALGLMIPSQLYILADEVIE
jgi:putative tryptophan/tyrosine transport system substrate-binding protein